VLALAGAGLCTSYCQSPGHRRAAGDPGLLVSPGHRCLSGGGGAYAVSRANLGAGFSLVAGAALIVDYTLTVSVSIAAGVGALTSAFPSLTSATVPICLAILAVITVLNLRGLGASARAFLLPTMLFIVGLLAVIAVGLIHPLGLKESLPADRCCKPMVCRSSRCY